MLGKEKKILTTNGIIYGVYGISYVPSLVNKSIKYYTIICIITHNYMYNDMLF